MTNTIIESTTLYFREGSSDKVYRASIESVGEGTDGDLYVVNFAYGRRGSTMNTGTKTPQPVDLAQARRIHSKLIASKLRKGYTPGQDGTPYRGTEAESIDTGIRPQLANPVSVEEARALLGDDRFCLQEKIDGRRMLVRKTGEGIIGINRRGLRVALPEPVAAEANRLPGTFLLDGEAVGDTLHVFDLLERDGVCQRDRGLIDRLAGLENLLRDRDRHAIVPVPPAFRENDKRALWAILVRQHAEGVVFKARHAACRPGRPASGGDWLKFKFVETASFLVTSAMGGWQRPMRSDLEVTFCDLQSASSSLVRTNVKSSGKRSSLRRTACLRARVSTPQSSARSRSSMTFSCRIQ